MSYALRYPHLAGPGDEKIVSPQEIPFPKVKSPKGIIQSNFTARELVESTVHPDWQTPGMPYQGFRGVEAGPVTYTVVKGDTLSKIAAANGTTWQELARINSISNPDLIHVGQVLMLRAPAKPSYGKWVGGALVLGALGYALTRS